MGSQGASHFARSNTVCGGNSSKALREGCLIEGNGHASSPSGSLALGIETVVQLFVINRLASPAGEKGEGESILSGYYHTTFHARQRRGPVSLSSNFG